MFETVGWGKFSVEGEALDGLKASISTFGYVEPIVWNSRTERVVGGHQRMRALTELGHSEAEVVVVDLSETDELALSVALNGRNISGDWTLELAPILNELEGNASSSRVRGQLQSF